MPLKSVLEIDVEDSKFRQFQELFAKYQEGLKAAPGMWGDVGKGIEDATSAASAMTKGTEAQTVAVRLNAQATHAMADLMAKGDANAVAGIDRRRKATESWGTSVSRAVTQFRAADQGAERFARNVASAAMSLGKINSLTAIATGALGLGGIGGALYGLDKLAAGAAADRRRSMSTGVPYGQQKAFELDYSRFGDPSSMMGNIATGKSDATSQQFLALRSAGISADEIRQKNAADLGVELYGKLGSLFPGGPDDPRFGSSFEARGLGALMSPEDAKRYLRYSPEERDAQRKKYEDDSLSFAQDPASLRKWDDLNTALMRAKDNIETFLVQGLAPLAPQFTKLSENTSTLISDFLKSKEVKTDLDDLATGLGTLDKALKDPDSWWNKAGRALNSFAKKEKEAGDATHSWVMEKAPWLNPGNIDWYSGGNTLTHHAAKRGHWLVDRAKNEPDFQSKADAKLRAFGGHPKGDGAAASGNAGGGRHHDGASLGDRARRGAVGDAVGPGYVGRGDLGKVSKDTLANGDESFAFWRSKGLSADAAAGLVGMEQGEALDNPGNKTGDGGNAHGSFQWHPDRRANIRAATGIDIDHATHRQQLEAAYWEFTQSKDAGARRAWDMVSRPGVTAGQAAAAGTTYFERPADKPGQSTKRGKFAQGWLDRERGRDPTAAPPSAPVATSGLTIGDQAALDARKRIAEGRGTDADRNAARLYREQQNRPPPPKPATHPDDDRASRAGKVYDGPYSAKGHLSPVQFTQGGGTNPLTELYRRGWGADMHADRAKERAATLQHMREQARQAAGLHHARGAPDNSAPASSAPPQRGASLKRDTFSNRGNRVVVENASGGDLSISHIGAAFG